MEFADFWKWPMDRAYSVRSACMGSTREARHAGSMHARAATTRSIAATSAYTAGSTGCVS